MVPGVRVCRLVVHRAAHAVARQGGQVARAQDDHAALDLHDERLGALRLLGQEERNGQGDGIEQVCLRVAVIRIAAAALRVQGETKESNRARRRPASVSFPPL